MAAAAVAVPEPAGWLTLIVGLAMLPAARRLRGSRLAWRRFRKFSNRHEF